MPDRNALTSACLAAIAQAKSNRSRATRRNPLWLLPSGSDQVSERKRPPDSRARIWRQQPLCASRLMAGNIRSGSVSYRCMHPHDGPVLTHLEPVSGTPLGNPELRRKKMLRTELCYRISRSLIKPPTAQASDADTYSAWREEEMCESWERFSDSDVNGKDVLDFGCGEGPLSLFLARTRKPRSIVGVDIDAVAIDRANAALDTARGEISTPDVSFVLGGTSGLPVEDGSADTILAFDCMEHVMEPQAILADWYRVLRPGGKVLIEWYPFKGPYGPHMSGLVPIPWAHVIFGEKALFETAARLYGDFDYVPGHWDLDEDGKKLPNKWASASTFSEQGYLNELDIPTFSRMVSGEGFRIVRQDNRGFGQSGAKQAVGKALLKLPVIDEYFISYTLIELQK